ncbi:MAG: hypothetical protein ACFB13_05450 [Kiloniellaceae bacterium]
MRRIFHISASVILVITLTGCGANFSSIYRTYQVEKPDDQANSVVIDAKQRAILSAPASGAFTSPQDYHRRRKVIVCAEPSPDALSAISSTFAASAGGLFPSGEQIQASLASALQETASQLGVRNATIQLLRDGLYRQCEAYMNGLIDKPYYEQIANKYANAMVTLLAIEELAGRGATSVKVAPSTGPNSTTNVNLNGPAAGAAPQPSPSPSPEPSAGGAAQDEGTTAPDPDGGGDAATGQSPDPNGGGGGSGSAEAEVSAGGPAVSVNLPQAASVQPHVSTAVNTMVTWFLTKDTVDYCLRGLLAGDTKGDAQFKKAFIDVCSEVIRRQMAQQEQMTAGYEISTAAGIYGYDNCSASIRSFWKPGGADINVENEARIDTEMKKLGITSSIIFLMNTKESAGARRQVGAALGLAGCS